MNRTSRTIGLAIVAALALPAAARALDVVDDWRKVGPPEDGDPPRAKWELSPAAAGSLVAANELAWRSEKPFRAREEASGTIENLLLAHRDAPADTAPRAPGAREAIPRGVGVIGRVRVGRLSLLFIQVRVDFFEPAGDYLDSTIAVVLDANGTMRDVAVVADGSGDGCYWVDRRFALLGSVLDVAVEHSEDGALCQGDPALIVCCEVVVGERIELEVGPAGRFVERSRRPSNVGGRYVDEATHEELLIEVSSEGPRVGYRKSDGAPWQSLKIKSFDPGRRVVSANFARSPVIYTLTVAPDGRTLVSAGSDRSRPQRFARVPLRER